MQKMTHIVHKLGRAVAFLLFSTVLVTRAMAANGFVVHRIDVEGLRRIHRATVLDYVPVRPGQRLYASQTDNIIRTLYSTGFFSNVSLHQVNGDLIISVVERPTVAGIDIAGNHKIKHKKIIEGLKKAGIVEGQVLDEYSLKEVKEAVQAEYRNMGLYHAQVIVSTAPAPRDRVVIKVRVIEGHVAKIRSIRIVGSHAFSQATLLGQISATTWRPWVFFTHSNRYAESRLAHDVAQLQMFYLDHGYLRFHLVHKTVDITPDGRGVDITFQISEGPRYTVSHIAIKGRVMKYGHGLRGLVTIKPGEVFSRKKLMKSTHAMTVYLADEGYAFAQVHVVPRVDDHTHTVAIDFVIVPGRHVYVRRIRFTGNVKTADFVLRREVRLNEGSPYSLTAVNESKRRLRNLGYLEKIGVEQIPVPGSTNLVDLDVHVKDVSSARANLNGGYSTAYGFIYGASLHERNFLGTGRAVSIGFNNSQYSQLYSFTYTNPYFTSDGHSLGYSIYSERVTPAKVNLTSYTMNTYGGDVIYGIPISPFSRLSVALGYQHITPKPGAAAPSQVIDFVKENGQTYNQVKLASALSYNTYDRALFPTKGFHQVAGAEVGLPVLRHELKYYRLTYQAGYYHPIAHGFIFHAYADLGYGDGYGGVDYPFFKNFYAGGAGTVRGYKANTLGPKGICGPGTGPTCSTAAVGGNMLAAGTLEVIVPNPFERRLRTSVFFDGGNVFKDRIRAGQMRYSVGVAFSVFLPILGQIQLFVAKGFHDQPGDQKRTFDFSFGSSL